MKREEYNFGSCVGEGVCKEIDLGFMVDERQDL